VKQNADFARRLRRNQTDAERVLWLRLRDRRLAGWKFKRQVPIDRYIVDFFCADGKLIIEIDGGQHEQRRERDGNRTAALEAMGYLVLRFWNNEVLQNTSGVLETILSTMSQPRPDPPHPTPLPSGEREPTESVAPSSTPHSPAAKAFGSDDDPP
jgi:very-short-patch-repair endonuclease